jgi:purine-nucleoside/S-methyl-5'-thioadenosine phosphorylase / adenosine deaminase
MSILKTPLIQAKWPAPSNIFAYTTTIHFGDLNFRNNPALMHNRQKLKTKLSLTTDPFWITQVHGDVVVNLDTTSAADAPEADGSYTQQANCICSIITADCLPILICSSDGQEIAALHAGWRSLLKGIISNGISLFKSPHHQLLVWLGPAISSQFFIVGDDVYEKFIQKDKQLKQAFTFITPRHFHCNLYELAKQELQSLGVTNIYFDNYCTYKNKTLFYSYRRQNEKAGRMATLIWRDR